MHDSEIIKALIVDTFCVDARYLELYARALERERKAAPPPIVSPVEPNPEQDVSPVIKGRGGLKSNPSLPSCRSTESETVSARCADWLPVEN